MSPTGLKNFQLIPKPLGLRIIELLHSLQVIRDSIEGVRQGKPYQFLPLYGQMRSLLTERSKGNEPLLVDLARIIGHEMRLYMMPATDDPSIPEILKRSDLVLHLAGFPLALRSELPAHREVSLEDFLNAKILAYKGAEYTAREVIELLANTAGGAHFAPKLSQDFAELMQFGFLGQPMLANALLQISQITFALGVRMLRTQIDREFHALVAIPLQSLSRESFLIDSRYPDSLMAFRIHVTPQRAVVVTARGIDGVSFQLTSGSGVSSEEPHHLAFMLRLSDELRSDASLYLDGIQVAHLVIPQPVFLLAAHRDFDEYYNRSQEDASAGLTFGLGVVQAYSGDRSMADQGAIFLHFRARAAEPDAAAILFVRDSFGRSPPGETDIAFTGTVRKSSLRKVLEGTTPSDAVTPGN
jgi:hypothetical protein